MVRSISTQDIIAKASQGYIKDYYVDSLSAAPPLKNLLRPLEDFDRLKELLKDHTFNSNVNILVDAIMKEGFIITERDDIGKRDTSKEHEFNKKYRAFKLLKQLLLNLIVYRNSFVEVVRRNGRADEVHMLETTEMNINVTEHGEVLGYTQIHSSGPYNQGKQYVFFEPDEAIHIAPSRITTNPWGYVDTQAIEQVVNAKSALEDYIINLFKQNKFRDVWFLKNASSPDQVKNMISSLKEGKIYPNKDIVIQGDAEQKQLRSSQEIQYLLTLYDNYEEQIRKFLRVPPIMNGDTDSKSSGEFQVRYAFDNTVIAWHRLLEDELTYELFPLLGWSTSRIIFLSIDKPSIKASIENAVQLKGLGYDDDTIHRYLVLNRVNLPANAHIKTAEEKAEEQEQMMSKDNDILDKKLQNMNAESRKPRDKSLTDKNVVEDRETREEQVVGK